MSPLLYDRYILYCTGVQNGSIDIANLVPIMEMGIDDISIAKRTPWNM
jgi:hypothetical protein